MATVPSKTQEGDTWSGLITGGKLPADLKKEGVTEATKLTFITRRYNRFTWTLHKNNPSSKAVVEDRVYRSRELTEFERTYPVSIGSSNLSNNTNHTKVGVPNHIAAQIQPHDILYLKNTYAYATFNPMVAGQVYPSQGNTQGTNVGPDLGWSTGANPTGIRFSRELGPDNNGNYFIMPEQVRVTDVGDEDSAGTGNTLITLRRYFAGPSAYDQGGAIVNQTVVNAAIQNNMNTGNQAAEIRNGDILLRGTNAHFEGTGYPSGVSKNPEQDVNYTQLYKYAMEVTREQELKQTFISEKQMDISRWLTTRRFNRDREYTNILGQKGKGIDEQGKEIYLMGGAREFVLKDPDHYIMYPSNSLQWNALQELAVPLLNLNNSGKMTALTGVSMDVALRQSFWNDHLYYNKEESKKYNMEVNTLILPGIELDIIVSQIIEEAGFGNEMICLDLTNKDNFEPVTNKGWDMIVEKDIQEKGLNIKKEGIQGMFGLHRRRKGHHAIINFKNAMP